MAENQIFSQLEQPSYSDRSYLPSWVLKMREKIEASRQVHQETADRLQNISSTVDSLSTKLLSLRPSSLQSTTNHGELPEQVPCSYSRVFVKFQIDQIPSDCWAQVFQFMKISELFKCFVISRQFIICISTNPIWHLIGRNECSYLNIEDIKDSSRKLCIIREHHIMRAKSMKFIAMMKEQRCTNRHNAIDPHRYTRFDTSVSHPIPVFDGFRSEKVMSNAETLSTDFRTLTHHSLEQMLLLTNGLYSKINVQLLECGIIAVLISLLANEEATIQNYSCHILANLLLWNALHSRVAQQTTPSILQQIDVCDGRRKLVKLLTSPSATVNLAVPKTTLHSFTKVTSNVQGVCNKQASRALILSFFPEYPVNSSTSFQRAIRYDWSTSLNLTEWQFTYFHKSGAFKDQTIVQFEVVPSGSCIGKGIDVIGAFLLYGSMENDIVGQVVFLSKSYCKADEQSNVTISDLEHCQRVAHVKHVCYWSDPVINLPAVHHNSDLKGLWGVWETCNSNPQFELQKGGVFRAFPLG